MPDAIQPDKEQKRLIRMAETISKALPYMRRHNDATFVVKYGGHAMTDPKLGDLFARDIVLMKQVGMNPIVVHGGGPQINKMLDRVGIMGQDGKPLPHGQTQMVYIAIPVKQANGPGAGQMIIDGMTKDAADAPGAFGTYRQAATAKMTAG